MTTDELLAIHRVELADGRTIACTNPQDAQIWMGMLQDSPYDAGLAALHAGDLVLDVGAHIGLTALYFADHVPGLRILAFEPTPDTYACLAENAARLMPGVVPVNAALGAEPGTAELTFYPNHTMMATLVADQDDEIRNMSAILDTFGVAEGARGQFWQDFRAGARRYPVRVTTLGEILDAEGDREVGLLKVDVERHELAVLRGLRPEQWGRVRQVVAEVHAINDNLDAVVALLRAQGYTTDVFQETVFAGGSVHVVYATRG